MAFPQLVSGGDPNCLLTGMILQVCAASKVGSFPQIEMNRKNILDTTKIMVDFDG